MIRVGIVSVIFGAIIVVAFNNCSSTGFNALDSIANTATAQCRANIRNSAKAELFADASVCDKPANYQCDLRRFRKGIGSTQTNDRACIEIAGLGETCVTVSTYNFDTAQQQKSAEASELIEGGAYNRDEATCFNTQVVSHQIPVIQEEGPSIADALERSIASCRQRSHL